MAEADKVSAVEHGGTLQGSETQRPALDLDSGSPTMPHLDLSAENLDILYPPLEAPADDRLEDLVDDKDDSVFQAGLKIAENIRSDMHVRGRRRRGAGESMTGLLGESSARRRGIHTDLLGLVGESCAPGHHIHTEGLVSESCVSGHHIHTERKTAGWSYRESHRRAARLVTTVPVCPAATGGCRSFDGTAADVATTSRRRGACITCPLAAMPGTTTSCTCSSRTSCPSSTTYSSPRIPCIRIHCRCHDRKRFSSDASSVCLLARAFGSKSSVALCSAVTT
jgi:hypothetical protein